MRNITCLSSGGRRREMKAGWHGGSVGVAAAGLFPLALRTPHVLVVHAVDLATLAALGAHPAGQRRAFWRGGQGLRAQAHELLRRHLQGQRRQVAFFFRGSLRMDDFAASMVL